MIHSDDALKALVSFNERVGKMPRSVVVGRPSSEEGGAPLPSYRPVSTFI